MMNDVKENRLPSEAIKPHAVIWYSGRTSMFGWDCPAEIMTVDEDKRVFTVRSLDDGKVQSQVYDFDMGEHSPTSRQSMFVPTNEQLLKYMEEFKTAFRSVGVREDADTESYFVDLDIGDFNHFTKWFVERWARMNNIDSNTFSAIGFSKAVCFKKAEDAVLFNLTFSRGVDWSKMR